MEDLTIKRAKSIEAETLAMLTRKYSEFLKKNMNRGVSGQQEPRRCSTQSQVINPSTIFDKDSNNKWKAVQYKECGGFEHIQVECANIIKKKANTMNAI
ncbi:hypothetical protein PanWU01x14_286760 [Parasponia andersonii]|uniref:Uncharacterized protein n=1 Tax=Parasponia andersonii TaxID=3476 RepID=A0A2P5AZ55_PARAD|nr:hypothetical protein PanWU01x14_286760 [Parasponia andersonii]